MEVISKRTQLLLLVALWISKYDIDCINTELVRLLVLYPQEKKVIDAMTPIKDVFMLSIDSRLDYETLAKVVRSGHSRVPVFEEAAGADGHISKKIIGILLVKQCVLLDPEGEHPYIMLSLY